MREEGAADDLFDEVVVDVYAGAEFGHFCFWCFVLFGGGGVGGVLWCAVAVGWVG